MQLLLDRESAARGLRRMAGEIIERHRGAAELVLVGIRRGGVPIAAELARWIAELEGQTVPMGTVDITLYRDDAATALPNPRIGPSEIPVPLAGRTVILVDDVLYSGRTVRAALDALLDYGRPRTVELAVLIDRGGRELPIFASYVAKSADVPADQRVDVLLDEAGLRAVLQAAGSPSVPPPGVAS
jgi:pyrimidine operon attenuation protein / uracil phosphoribosyltransferase